MVWKCWGEVVIGNVTIAIFACPAFKMIVALSCWATHIMFTCMKWFRIYFFTVSSSKSTDAAWSKAWFFFLKIVFLNVYSCLILFPLPTQFLCTTSSLSFALQLTVQMCQWCSIIMYDQVSTLCPRAARSRPLWISGSLWYYLKVTKNAAKPSACWAFGATHITDISLLFPRPLATKLVPGSYYLCVTFRSTVKVKLIFMYVFQMLVCTARTYTLPHLNTCLSAVGSVASNACIARSGEHSPCGNVIMMLFMLGDLHR